MARAAWLVSSFPVTVQDGNPVVDAAAERIGSPVPNRIGGLPPQLEVWGIHSTELDAKGNPLRLLIGTLQPDGAEGEVERTTALDAVTFPQDAESVGDTWWANWDQAKKIGLGGEWELPAGWTRSSLQAIYVVGIGEESPDNHFQAHADAGELGVLRLGEPTNSVHGAPAADLADNAAVWLDAARWRIRQKRDPNDVAAHFPHLEAISAALLGSGSATLPFIPGGANDTAESQRLVRALWPSLWGHCFRDLWGMGDEAHELGLWAMEYLMPEGPLSPIRIADQPYGLLPVTALSQWKSIPNDRYEKLEEDMARQLVVLRQAWARAAETRGTSFGADMERLTQLLGSDAVTATYIYRNFLSTDLLAIAYPADPNKLRDAAAPGYKQASSLAGREPQRFYLATGNPEYLKLPLIAATRAPANLYLYDIIAALLKEDNEDLNFYMKILRGILPDSLLIRLMMNALMLSQAWYNQSAQGDKEPLLERTLWNDDKDWSSVIHHWRQHFWDTFNRGEGKPAIEQLVKMQLDPLLELAQEIDQWWEKVDDPLRREPYILRLNIPAERQKELERAFRATLDTAAYRIDPWLTGIAWRRLKQFSGSSRRLNRLGAYGWVDGPFVGEPGPTAAGRLHAPSHAMALTGVILRDKYVSAAHEQKQAGERNAWKMNLDSERVRTAALLAEEVRMGFHLYEVLGRWVEGIIGTHAGVAKLRKTYPMRQDAHPNETCQGLEALNGLLDDGAAFGLAEEQRSELVRLQQSLDAYADLLVADAVHQVVTGRPDKAAETMDAAAGLSRPPTFESVRTPPSGYLLHTSILSALPWTPPASGEDAHPFRIAEPSLMAYIDTQFPDPASFVWQAAGVAAVRGDGEAHDVPRTGSASLAQLGLTMGEAALLPEDVIADIVCSLLGIDRASEVAPPPHYRTARQMTGMLSGQPAPTRTIAADGKITDTVALQLDDTVSTELAERLELLKTACGQTLHVLAAAADDTARIAALHRALQWGIVPTSDPVHRRLLFAALFAGVLPTDEELLAQLASTAHEALQNRLHAVPESAPKDIPELARSLSALATPEAQLPILARWETSTLLALAEVEPDKFDSALDAEWLAAVAAVRPPLARLEALQLQAALQETHQPLLAHTNSPGDPWRKKVIEANNQARAAGYPTDISTPRFIAAYSASDAWQGKYTAVGLLDQFSESIPMPQRTTYAAFGFNAPASRAPQAILLAVPPIPRTRLEGELLLDIVAETREQAHARAARPEDLGDYQAMMPSMWFQGSGPDRVRLDTSTQYWR